MTSWLLCWNQLFDNLINISVTCWHLKLCHKAVILLTFWSVFEKWFLFHCHPPHITFLSLFLSSFLTCLFTFWFLPVSFFFFSLFQEGGGRQNNEWSEKSHGKCCFVPPSLFQLCVITNFVCVLCLQEKEKADGNIDQCEYT